VPEDFVMKMLLVFTFVGAAVVFCLSAFGGGTGENAKQIRVGIIGLDTSHCVAFTKILNDAKAEDECAGFRVVAAYPGGSPDIPANKDRVAGFTATLRDKHGVEIVDSIAALLKKVDVVLIESVDGRPHLEQAALVIKAGKTVFIDKPIAGSLADALRIFELAAAHKVPIFSSSALRFSPGIAGAHKNPKVGRVRGCFTYAPCELEKHHPDLFWYGVHGVEALYTVMGTGCKTVTRAHTKKTDVVTGVWADGRVGTFQGLRDVKKTGYGTIVFGSEGIVDAGGFGGYQPLVSAICKFFRTGQPPVSAAETTELFAFMEAADESKRQQGAPVTIESVMQQARAENARRAAK
jgi:predicted dehydrogenase